MVPFGGYDMPVQYPKGIIAEHLHTRAAAGLFDVSHMGQAILAGPNVAAQLERLVPGELRDLAEHRTRYTQLLDDNGNILDDLMVTRLPPVKPGIERFFLVVNAGTKTADFAHIAARLPELELMPLADRALLALQGPQAVSVMARLFPGIEQMKFMSFGAADSKGGPIFITRSGYTGEDGFEISVQDSAAAAFARLLLDQPEVQPIGLGARDSLRLEAGLCLYGHDIDTTTTPIEAGLLWSISKRRRIEGGFPGDERVRLQIENGPPRKRIGLLPEGRAVAREGADITTPEGRIVGRVTSGGFSPSLGRPIAMGYVEQDFAKPGTPLALTVRNQHIPAIVTPMPFVPTNFYRG